MGEVKKPTLSGFLSLPFPSMGVMEKKRESLRSYPQTANRFGGPDL